MSKVQEFNLEASTLIRAKYSLLVVLTSEENRAIKLLQDAAKKNAGAQFVYEWSFTAGMRNEKGDPEGHDGTAPQHDPFQALCAIEKMETPPNTKSVYILKDFHKFMENPQIQRKLRDLSSELKYTSKTVVFLSPSFKIPDDLSKSMTVLELPLPDANELRDILCEALAGLKNQEDTLNVRIKENSGNPKKVEDIKTQQSRVIKNRKSMEDQEKKYGDRIISAGLGLTCIEFEDVIAKCIVGGSLDIKLIIAEKKQIIKKSGVLEYFDTSETAASIGGLKVLKKYITSVARRLSAKAREFGLEPQKGVLLIGIPGGGKSLTAKAAADSMQLPLIRLDIGSLFGSLVGESESRTRQALKLADAIAPCILWIDEIEKGMSFGDGSGDSGTGQRIFATLLTWMEENQGVYVIATCNSHTALKAELMARFSRIFFVDVPTLDELREIITIHLVKVGRDPADFDIDAIIKAANGFVGREVRNTLQEALGAAFDEEIPLNTEHIIHQFQISRPITVQKAKEIEAMRSWAENNAINASEVPIKKSAATSNGQTRGRFDSDIGLDDIIKS